MNRKLATFAGLLVAPMCVAAGVLVWSGRAHPVLKLTFRYPHASATVVDDTVVPPIWPNLMGSDSIQTMIAVTTYGRTDIYVTGSAGANSKSLLTAVAERQALALPALPKSVVSEADMLPAGDLAPTPQTAKLVEDDRLEVDRAKAEAAGISIAEVNSQLIKHLDSGHNLQDFLTTPIRLPDGKTVPVSEIGTVEKHQAMEPIVRTYP